MSKVRGFSWGDYGLYVLLVVAAGLVGAAIGALSGVAYEKHAIESEAREQGTDIVWVCMGSSSGCYHADKNCKGLSNCGGPVLPTSRRFAEQEMEYRPCRLCVKDYVYLSPYKDGVPAEQEQNIDSLATDSAAALCDSSATDYDISDYSYNNDDDIQQEIIGAKLRAMGL